MNNQLKEMERLICQQSPTTPYVCFDLASGVLEITGKVIPHDTIEFVKPLRSWIDHFSSVFLQTGRPIVLHLHFNYYNTPFGHCLRDLFKTMEQLHAKGLPVTVFWYYEKDDEDMMENGEEFKDLLRCPFPFHLVERAMPLFKN